MQKLIDICRQLTLRRSLIALGLLLVLACTQGRAQSTQGSITGSVKDAAGAVVPGANVTLTNTDEGAVRTTRTDGVGDYRFQDVKEGHYTVEISAPSFEKWAASGVTLEVRQELRVDAKLAVGAVQQEIHVTGDMVSAIETDSPTINATFTSEDTNNLPVNTRASFSGTSAAAILGTLPGVQDDASGISLQGALPFQRSNCRRHHAKECNWRNLHCGLLSLDRGDLRDSRRRRAGQRRIQRSRADRSDH